MIAEVVTWPVVALALVTALPGLLAAYYARDNKKQLKTENGRTVGRLIEEVHEVAADETAHFPTEGPPGPQ